MSDDTSSTLELAKTEKDFFKRAYLLDVLKKQHKVRIKDLSKSLDIKPSYICHILRLNKLPDIIKDGYYAQMVSVSHLFIIARLSNHADMLKVYEKVLGNSLTALQTDELVREVLYSVSAGGEHVPAHELKQQIQRVKDAHKDIHVKVIQTRVKGKIVIEVKGGLQQTTPLIRKIIQKLES